MNIQTAYPVRFGRQPLDHKRRQRAKVSQELDRLQRFQNPSIKEDGLKILFHDRKNELEAKRAPIRRLKEIREIAKRTDLAPHTKIELVYEEARLLAQIARRIQGLKQNKVDLHKRIKENQAAAKQQREHQKLVEQEANQPCYAKTFTCGSFTFTMPEILKYISKPLMPLYFAKTQSDARVSSSNSSTNQIIDPHQAHTDIPPWWTENLMTLLRERNIITPHWIDRNQQFKLSTFGQEVLKALLEKQKD